MLSGYVIAFLTLIVVSIVANIFRKIFKSENVFLHALSFVPITCSFISLLWGFSLILSFIVFGVLLSSIATFLNEPSFTIAFFLLFGFITLLNFLLCLYILYKFAKRNLKENIVISYATCFVLSGFFGVITCVYFFFNAFWHSQDVGDYFSYESQRLPAFCSEYNLRIGFNSGKKINIHLDTCGNSDYDLFKLENGDIYMQAESGRYQPSYIVSIEKEEVFYILNSNMYKLNGDAICGYGGDSKITSFSTYKGDLSNRTGSFTTKAIPLGDSLNNKTALGALSVYSFIEISDK